MIYGNTGRGRNQIRPRSKHLVTSLPQIRHRQWRTSLRVPQTVLTGSCSCGSAVTGSPPAADLGWERRERRAAATSGRAAAQRRPLQHHRGQHRGPHRPTAARIGLLCRSSPSAAVSRSESQCTKMRSRTPRSVGSPGGSCRRSTCSGSTLTCESRELEPARRRGAPRRGCPVPQAEAARAAAFGVAGGRARRSEMGGEVWCGRGEALPWAVVVCAAVALASWA